MYHYYIKKYRLYPTIAQKGLIDFNIIKHKLKTFNLDPLSINDNLYYKIFKSYTFINNYYNIPVNSKIKLLNNGILLPQIGIVKCCIFLKKDFNPKICYVFLSEDDNKKYFINIIFKLN